MPDKSIRIVLAEPDYHLLPGAFETLRSDSDISLFSFREPIAEIWKSVMSRAPEITILYTPTFGEEESKCIGRILSGSHTYILLVAERLDVPELKNPRVETLILRDKGRGYTSFLNDVHIKAKRRATQNRSPEQPSDMQKAVNSVQDMVRNAFSISEQSLQNRIIAIGASTGGTEAMAKIFKMLPKDMPGIVVVQHMPPVFTNMYAERLNRELSFTVSEAKDEVQILPRTIHIAPGDRHLVIKKRGNAFYTKLGGNDKVNGHCPSVDVLFNSVGNEAGRQAIGIILTGMGADGASGLLHMRNRGAYTIGQDEASSVVYGMPKKAFDYGAVVKQASLSDVAKVLMSFLSSASGS